MSTNVSIAFKVVFEKDGASVCRGVFKPITLSGDSFIHNIQIINLTTLELLEIPANLAPANGIFFAVNQGSFDIAVFPDGLSGILVEPGCFCCFRLGPNVSNIYAINAGGQSTLEYAIVEA